MISGVRGGWQTIIADLSLILFMVTTAAMVNAPETPAASDMAASSKDVVPAHGTPLGVYRAGAGAPPLSQWLAVQAPDDRQRLTVIARYPAGEDGLARASAAALKLAAEAARAGTAARIVMEPLEDTAQAAPSAVPGAAIEVSAVLAFDAAEHSNRE